MPQRCFDALLTRKIVKVVLLFVLLFLWLDTSMSFMSSIRWFSSSSTKMYKKLHQPSLVVEATPTRYYTYFICSGNRTYNGYTVDPARRLRQHNGLIKGGARSTRMFNNWEFLAVLTSNSWNSISRTMQIEWLCKYPTRKKPRPRIYSRPIGRLQSLQEVFTHTEEDIIDVYVHSKYIDVMKNLTIPSTVRIHEGFEGLAKYS